VKNVCEWKLVPGKKATYNTSCGKVMVLSEPPEDGEECPCCDRPVEVK